MGEFPNRIRELRKARGITLERIAEATGLSPPYLSRLEKGDRNLAVKHLAGIADALGVSEAELIEHRSSASISIVGIVGLGEEVEWHGEGDMHLGEVEVQGLTSADGLIALEARGDSMRPRVYDRELVVARKRDGKDPRELIGREAVVKLRNGPVLLKRIRRGFDPGRFHLESYNADTRENVEIEWVAELVSIIPEGAWRRA